MLTLFAVLFCTSADLPVAPPPREVDRPTLPAGVDPALADWTPRPATGKAETWEKATDPDWVDGRFRLMDTGTTLGCSLKLTRDKSTNIVTKSIVIKLGVDNESGVIFDRATMNMRAGWEGGYLTHGNRRFGLLNTPSPAGKFLFSSSIGPGWADPQGNWDAAGPFTAPLPREWMQFLGVHLHGDRVVLRYRVSGTEVFECPTFDNSDGPTITRQFLIAAHDSSLRLALPTDARVLPADLKILEKPVRHVLIPASKQPLTLQVVHGTGSAAKPQDLATLAKPGPRHWGEPLITALVKGDAAGPFAVDTLTIPYQNPFGALFFCTGLDHLPDGRIAVCTCHGDVWLVRIDEKAGTCSWQRFATGLYHPLGLKVVDGQVVVLERGQLTRLHDGNADGEADFYECLTNDWHTGNGEHAYDTCLETDPAGNFYFFKTGDTNLPSGGCLLRAAKDGSQVEVYATGFRHPIGLGMSPSGIVTGADQEGNWMPATRIDEYRRGGFYGDMRANHRTPPPTTYDGPLCWVPREIDNSAGGQVWVPPNTFGPLAGLPLHFSYGRCRPYVLLRQECGEGVVQGGVTALDVNFLSGVCRGRFGPDGHLYVCGLNGWQTAAKADGCLQRMRVTGQPLDVPVKLAVAGNTVRLTFSRPLDRKRAEDVANYKAAWWNYRWSGEYGSKRWKLSDPRAEGQDEFAPMRATLAEDGRTVVLHFAELKPVMQMQVGFNIAASDGRDVVGSVFLTIHTTGK